MKYLFTMYIRIQPILNRLIGISLGSKRSMKINKNMTCRYARMYVCL